MRAHPLIVQYGGLGCCQVGNDLRVGLNQFITHFDLMLLVMLWKFSQVRGTFSNLVLRLLLVGFCQTFTWSVL